MCGIAGVMRLDGSPVDPTLVSHMIGLLGHRGPDDEGLWIGTGVVLGHRRLVVVDPHGSRQPIDGPTGLHLVGNGEILNHVALRSRCSRHLRSRGDMEVIVGLHESVGGRAPSLLEGQFAYALYDERERSLLLVRDRFGILPLYWWASGGLVAFASEPKALLPVMGRPRLDPVSVADHLAGRAVPAPHTLFQGVRKVLPGHAVRFCGRSVPQQRRWWAVPTPDEAVRAAAETTGSLDDRAAIEAVEHAVRRSVEDNLMADVPVGSLLSGGVDSSLVAALTQEASGGPLHTFSAGFAGCDIDELPGALEVSQTLGTRHHEVIVRPEDLRRLWGPLTWHRDAPLSEPADVAVHLLASAAKEHVTVLLSGEGADELFGGYPKYRMAGVVEALGRVPLTRALASGALGRGAGPAGLSGRRARTVLAAAAARSETDRFRAWFAPFGEDERRRLLGGALVDAAAARGTWPTAGGLPDDLGGSAAARMQWADCHSWLSDNLLERADRMSMAASVEVRPPLVDHRLLDLAFGLRERARIRGGVGKWVLRRVAALHLPDHVASRQKAGFPVPLASWFRGPLRDFVHDTLTDPTSLCRELLDEDVLRALLDDHDSGRRDAAAPLFTLVGLEVWNETFLAGQGAPASPLVPAASAVWTRRGRAGAPVAGAAGPVADPVVGPAADPVVGPVADPVVGPTVGQAVGPVVGPAGARPRGGVL